MLIQIDRTQLGDSHLDAVENLAKLREDNAVLDQKFKIYGQAELEKTTMECGTPMAYQNLIRLITRINPSIICEDGGYPNAIAVRIPGIQADGTYGKRYVTGFQKEVLQEFSGMRTDERGRPHREVRGWRTVVLALIRQHIISYKNAVDVFGEPNGSRAGRWQQLLRDNKN